MAGNKFSKLNSLPSEDVIKKIVSDFTYKRINIQDLPEPIIENGLVEKCNSFIVCASGSTDAMLYSFIGIRPDKGDVVDEHPFVLYYDHIDASKNFGGIIHHGNWEGRTTELEQWQINALDSSGLTAGFSYKQIPIDSSGTLADLNEKGMLKGLSKQFDVLVKNNPFKI